MLAAIAVASINYGNGRNLRRPPGSIGRMVPNDDDVAIAGEDADGVFNLLGFDLRGECARLLSREHAPAQPQHGRFERKTRPHGRRVEECRHDAVLIVESAPARDYAFHAAGTIEEFHQQRNRELLRFDHMSEPASGARIDRKSLNLP